jgi:mRNA interferase RelE/StbE
VKYGLTYTRKAIKDIRKLEPKVKDRIGKALLRYAGDPLKHAEKLTEPRLGEYRFRIGDYRVIFDLEGEEIVVLRAGHRKDIYRKL